MQENGNVKKKNVEDSPSVLHLSTLTPACIDNNEVAAGGPQDDNKSVQSEKNEEFSLVRYPCEQSFFRQFLWFLTWPIYFVFFFTIPDCERPRFKKLFPLTFIMCIVWIGSLSYLVAWMITIIGDTLRIPDSVMGITFLAAGTSVPEAVSSVIVAKQGECSARGTKGAVTALNQLVQQLTRCVCLFIECRSRIDGHFKLNWLEHVRHIAVPGTALAYQSRLLAN